MRMTTFALDESSLLYRYLEWYAKSPEIIREMDHLFVASHDHPEKKMEYGQQLQALVPMSGHPTGFYMANLIIEQLGNETLVKDIGNPYMPFLPTQDPAVKTRSCLTGVGSDDMYVSHGISNKIRGVL
jgi:hypothetical protein